jgi:MraZ protein
VGKCGVNDVIFQGTSALSLDAKGRMNIPQKHRDVLFQLCQGQLTLTKHPDGCLQLLPRQVWEQLRSSVAALPMNGGAVKRFFLGSAADVEMDAAGRILISPELREYAKLAREVVLLGVGGHFEVWDSLLYAQAEQKAIDAGMSELLNGLSF